MAVFPPDERRIIRPIDDDFTQSPLPSVTAIDTTINIPTTDSETKKRGVSSRQLIEN